MLFQAVSAAFWIASSVAGVPPSCFAMATSSRKSGSRSPVRSSPTWSLATAILVEYLVAMACSTALVALVALGRLAGRLQRHGERGDVARAGGGRALQNVDVLELVIGRSDDVEPGVEGRLLIRR